jgi:hypothetical protein
VGDGDLLGKKKKKKKKMMMMMMMMMIHLHYHHRHRPPPHHLQPAHGVWMSVISGRRPGASAGLAAPARLG